MTIGRSVRQKAAAATRQWQQLRFQTLRRQLVTPHEGEIRLPLVSREVPAASHVPLAIKLETSHEEFLRWCQLEYFGYFHPAPAEGRVSGRTSTEVCLHVGPPKPLGYPYSLIAEVENFTDAVRHGEAYAAWEEADEATVPHSTRWLTQSLLDGFVTRRVSAHVGLSSGSMPQTLVTARQLKVTLPPCELSPFYFANDLLSSWGVFGATEPSDAEFANDDISRLVQLAHASAVLPMYRAIWLNGAALCNENGDAVLILGPRRSGKTTLALHCLAMSSARLRLVGLENFHLALANTVVNTEPPDGPTTLLMGLPASASVGLGAIIGTLRPNPSLAMAAHGFNYSPSNIQQLVRNSEMVLWNMNSRYGVHIEEAFGPQRWCPTWLGKLKGIVMLNWDLQELLLPQSYVKTQALQWKSKPEIYRLLMALAENKGAPLFKGHYLLRSIYDETNAPNLLEEFLSSLDESNVPPLYELRGSVSFDMAVELICKRIFNCVE
ncbi:hypothetical protein DQ04_00041030 [Trypanosoma grayi]|uniref:hypothetical protein n=1 Tax=Trypanosoma grayi TaxID=71804 RepID=UPI0004F40ADC|nr:hypothetical protein DQ04_00041030 [Trypanosoma grayi]KEG15539.1 hypothetical protein DQ04_00041030 [Trypanosoma grayi]